MNIRNVLVAIWPRTKLKVFTIPIEHHIIQSHQLFIGFTVIYTSLVKRKVFEILSSVKFKK